MQYIRKSLLGLTFLSLISFIVLSPYKNGLFFDTDFYWIELAIISIIFLFLLVSIKDHIKIFYQPAIVLLALIPVIYGLNIIHAENQLLAFQHFFRWVTYLLLFIGTFILKDKKWTKEIVWGSFILASVWISIFGWMAAYGLTYYKDAFLDNRISSIFQYPNTLGAFLAAALLSILIRSTVGKWPYILTSSISYLLFSTMIFTYSRGTWLLFAIIWVLPIFIMKFRDQILYGLHTLLLLVGLLFTIDPLSHSITDQNGTGFIIIIVTSIILSSIYALVHISLFLIEDKIKFKMNLRWVLPILMIIGITVGALIIKEGLFLEQLPKSFQSRITDINFETRSVAERNLFYEDSTLLIKDYLFFGAGGGAWKQLYERYQSFPYISSQAHNFYLQTIMEIGIVGLILFSGFVSSIIYGTIRNLRFLNSNQKNQVLSFSMIVLFMLTHSFIDFNMSFAYFSAIVLIFMAFLAYPIELKAATFTRIRPITYLLFGILFLFSFISIIWLGRFIYAEQAIKHINGKSFVEEKLNKAIKANPYDINYRIVKINVIQSLSGYGQEKALVKEVASEIIAMNESTLKDPFTLLRTARFMGSLGYTKDAIEVLDEGIKYGPWREPLYTQKAIYLYNLAKYYIEVGNKKESYDLIKEIPLLYEEILSRRKFLDQQIPSLQYRIEFQPSSIMLQYVGQAYIIEGEFEKGLNLLIPLTNHADVNIKRDALAWTIFAYQKLEDQNKVIEFRKTGETFDINLIVDEINHTWNKKINH